MVIYDLEEEIMKCWSLVDDLRVLSNNADDLSHKDLSIALAGLAVMSEAKFQGLYKAFERLFENNFAKDKNISAEEWQAFFDNFKWGN